MSVLAVQAHSWRMMHHVDNQTRYESKMKLIVGADDSGCVENYGHGLSAAVSEAFTRSRSRAKSGSTGISRMTCQRRSSRVSRAPATGDSSATGRWFFVKTNTTPVCRILARQSPRLRAASVVDISIFIMRKHVNYGFLLAKAFRGCIDDATLRNRPHSAQVPLLPRGQYSRCSRRIGRVRA